MNALTPLKMTKSDFTRWVEGRSERFELVNGVPCMMVRAMRAHDKVVMNWFVALNARLDRNNYVVHSGEFALSTGSETFRLPDVSVERIGFDDAGLEMTDPLLLVEVLSPSTAFIDLNEKTLEYQAMPSLHAYVICAQDARCLWLYERGPEGWPEKPLNLTGFEDVVSIAALQLMIPLSELYFGVTIDNA